MAVITLPQTTFQSLKKRAELYDVFLRTLPERRWGIEEYSPQRLKEFTREDRIDPKTRSRLRKLLALR